MAQAEEGYEEKAGEWAGKTEGGNKEQQWAEMQRRKWTGKRNLELSSWDSMAEGEPISFSPGPLRVVLFW